jgi:hypothetical protein
MKVRYQLHYLRCSSDRLLRLSVPVLDAPLPEVDSIDELRTMPDAPKLRFEIVSDDDDEDGATNEELREAIVFLEFHDLIPAVLGATIRCAIQ